jgi:hypothetical protein
MPGGGPVEETLTREQVRQRELERWERLRSDIVSHPDFNRWFSADERERVLLDARRDICCRHYWRPVRPNLRVDRTPLSPIYTRSLRVCELCGKLESR